VVYLMHHCGTVGTKFGGEAVGCNAECESVHLGVDAARRGQCLQRRCAERAAIVFDDNQHTHFSNPSSSRRSTTAGAASGPVPNMMVWLTCSAA